MTNGRRIRGLAAIVLVLSGVPGAVPDAGAVGEEFEGYQAVATGSAYTVFPTFPTLIPYDASIEATVSLTTTTLSTGGTGFGRSSTFWPGVLAGIGPLVKILRPDAPPIPDYPIVVESRDFEDPKQSDQPGLSMRTDVTSTKAVAEALASDLGVPEVFTIGSARSISTSTLEGGKVGAVSNATISDVEFAAGTIHIGSIDSTASAISDGTTGSCEGSSNVTGVTVAGQKAIVDKNGVRAADDAKPLVPGTDPNTAIAATLKASGVQMRVIDGVGKCDGADVSRSSGGLLIQLPVPSPGIGIPPGSTMNMLLGSTNVNAAASRKAGSTEAEFVPGDTGAVDPGTPILGEAVPRVPGPVVGGSSLSPVDTAPSAEPPTGSGETALPFTPEETGNEYDFNGVPPSMVIGFLIAGAFGVRRISRYMERLYTMSAIR